MKILQRVTTLFSFEVILRAGQNLYEYGKLSRTKDHGRGWFWTGSEDGWLVRARMVGNEDDGWYAARPAY
jgi:hypothetical protein